MRVALVHHRFGSGGGLEGYLGEFVRHLAPHGHELEVVTARVGGSLPKIEGLRIHQVPRLPLLRSVRLLQFCRDSERRVDQLGADVVIGFGQTVAQDIHRAGGGCHQVYSRQLPPWKRFSLKNQLELRLEHQLYTSGRTRHFVVNAEKVSQELQEYYQVAPDRITVIHTPVDLDHYRPHSPETDPDRSELRRQFSPRSDAERPVFLFVSLDHARKGLDVLLQIWDQVDADLWIVGSRLSGPARQRVESPLLRDKITVLGRQSDLTPVYQAADCFIHPTRYDACANTVLQSMACGLPGIISVNDGAIDFVDDGQTGFLLRNPTDPEAVLARVQRVLALSQEERQAMGVACRERIQPQTWENHVSAWIPLLNRFRK